MNDQKGSDLDAREAVEGTRKGTVGPGGSKERAPDPADRSPAAGPHDDPSLINPDATPGAGTLPDTEPQDDTGSTSA